MTKLAFMLQGGGDRLKLIDLFNKGLNNINSGHFKSFCIVCE